MNKFLRMLLKVRVCYREENSGYLKLVFVEQFSAEFCKTKTTVSLQQIQVEF